MAKNYSFDIISEVNFMEIENAISQAKKELLQRYDFKGSKSSIDYDKQAKKIVIVGDDEFKLTAVRDIVDSKLAKRGISLKCIDAQKIENAFEGTLRQNLMLTSGLPKEKAKELVKLIKESKSKVQTQIDGAKVKVSSPKKDELQAVMTYLKDVSFSLPLQFENYR